MRAYSAIQKVTYNLFSRGGRFGFCSLGDESETSSHCVSLSFSSSKLKLKSGLRTGEGVGFGVREWCVFGVWYVVDVIVVDVLALLSEVVGVGGCSWRG